MLHIALDGTPIIPQGKGLSRFLIGLVQALGDYAPQHHFSVFIHAAVQHATLPQAPNITYIPVSFQNSLIWDLVLLPRILQQHVADLFLSCSDRLPLFHSKPMLLYLFEIPHERHKLSHGPTSAYARISMRITEWLFPHSLRRSRYIVTSSRATRQALPKWGVPNTKTQTIYPGLPPAFTPELAHDRIAEIRARWGAEEGYVLHFSSTSDPRDNTPAALRAFHTACTVQSRPTKLVIAGKTDPQAQRLAPLLDELALHAQTIWAGFVSDQELVNLYQGANVYLDPSLYEGFGYQVIEAMACGTPVVCSNVTSLPELAGDAAILASPHDIQSLAAGIDSILSSPTLAHAMCERGLRQAAQFTWPNMVTELVDVIETMGRSR